MIFRDPRIRLTSHEEMFAGADGDSFDDLLKESSFGSDAVREIQGKTPPDVRKEITVRMETGCASPRGTIDDIVLRLVWLCRVWGEGEPPPGFYPPVDASPQVERGEVSPSSDGWANDDLERALERWPGNRTTQVIAPTADGAAMIIHEMCGGRPARMLRYLIDAGAVSDVSPEIAWRILHLSYKFECSQPVPSVVLDAAESVLRGRCVAGYSLLHNLADPDQPALGTRRWALPSVRRRRSTPDAYRNTGTAPAPLGINALPHLADGDPAAPMLSAYGAELDPSAYVTQGDSALDRVSPAPWDGHSGHRRDYRAIAVSVGLAAAAVFIFICLIGNARAPSHMASATWTDSPSWSIAETRADTAISMALSLDARRLVIGGRGDIAVSDLDRKTTVRLSGPSSATAVAVSPNGRLVAGGGPADLRLWDLTTAHERELALMERTGTVKSVAFSPDGSTLASGSADSTVRLWDTSTGRLLAELLRSKGAGTVNSVAFSPDGKTLASGSADSTVLLWDLDRQALRQQLTAHTGAIRVVAFSPDGRTLASGSVDSSIRLWDTSTGRLLTELRRSDPTGTVNSIAFSPDGKTLASGSADSTVQLWDLDRQALRQQLTADTGAIRAVAFSPDGKTLATASRDIRLWRRSL